MAIVRKRRSTRSFKPDAVPDQLIRDILEAGRWAMSGANAQPWEFIIVKDPDTRLKIATLQSEYWKWSSPLEFSRAPALRHPGGSSRGKGPARFALAPVLVAILGDPRTLITSVVSATILGGEREVFHHGMANAAMLIHLATAAAGLNSEWISVNPAWEGSLKNLLEVPELYRLPLMAALGYGAAEPRPGFRRPLDEMVHHEKYDLSRFRSSERLLDHIEEIHQHRDKDELKGYTP